MTLLVMALLLSAGEPVDRWVPVRGGEATHRDYLDRQSIQRNAAKVTLWTRREFAEEQRTLWQEIEIDCASGSDTIIAWVEDAAGSVSHNLVRPYRPSAKILPNTSGQALFDLVCS